MQTSLREKSKEIGFFWSRPLSEASAEDNYIQMCLFNRWLMECYYMSVIPNNDEIGNTWVLWCHYTHQAICWNEGYGNTYDSAFEEGLLKAIEYVKEKYNK